jgi:hypothetical protein
MQEPYKEIFEVYTVTFYVLINSAFVGQESFGLIKMHGKTTIKITRQFQKVMLQDYTTTLLHYTAALHFSPI